MAKARIEGPAPTLDFYTYMLRCADGHYYVGHTDDLDARVAQHQAGEIPGYTETRRPVTLVWSDRFPERDQAFAAERKIKGWSRAKKEALIRGDWEALRGLARKPVLRYAASPSSAATQDERRGEPQAPAPAFVLVRPQLGENIGKAARAMLNFGLTDLRLVAPRDGWPNPAAGPAASGADIVLERARLFDTVAEAVADCAHVYATTVRKRGLVVPVVSPERAGREVHRNDGPSAFLFGAERSGLETDEVALAGKIVTVPVNPDFRSLNLAQAVILIAYEWSKHGEDLAVPTAGDDAEPRAPQAHLEGLIEQLYDALEAADYFHPPDRTPATRNTIRTIFTKAGWSSREVQALRGIIRALAEPRRRRT
ncbi:MAG TPA: TrmH family RNA methyltransferase [Allosphingosinicella sp.]|nr:TrmH family RNA methyltransferase [Allosphingosinicella sp.]